MTHNFCEVLQPRAHHLHRHALHVPRPGGRRRPARAAARLGEQRARSTPRSTRRSPRKPKGHDFVIDRRHQRPARAAPHERDRRLIVRLLLFCLALAALPHAVQAQETWTTYRNTRFGTSIEYPTRFKPGRPPDNNDGQSFDAPDGATLAVWGSFNVLEHDVAGLEAFLRENAAKEEKISYRAAAQNWLVLSGTRGDRIFYTQIHFLAPQRGRERFQDQLSGRACEHLQSDDRAHRQVTQTRSRLPDQGRAVALSGHSRGASALFAPKTRPAPPAHVSRHIAAVICSSPPAAFHRSFW